MERAEAGGTSTIFTVRAFFVALGLMEPKTILWIVISIATAGYILDQVLDWLNLRAMRRDVPDEVAEFYDRDRYLKSLDYHGVRTRFSFLSSAFSFAVTMLMLLAGGFGWLDTVLRTFVDSEILLSLAFFGVLALASDVLSVPFQVYATFVIEERYGFNRTTPRTFILDKLKGYLLGAVIGAPLLGLLIWLVMQIGPGFWLWFGVTAALFVLFVNVFYTTLILPLFNKLTPLPDGELKSAIEAFAAKVNFPLDNIFVIDGSRRSSKANAFFSGMGRRKKIVLYDTLIDKHATDELVAILAHEVGHFKKKHIVQGFALSVVQIFFTLFVLSLMVYNESLSFALGGNQHSIHLNLIVFSILFAPISGVIGILMQMLSRKNEFEADAYAREHYDGPALAAALKKLSVDSLSNLFPHPLYVFFHYSHPPLLARLRAIERQEEVYG